MSAEDQARLKQLREDVARANEDTTATLAEARKVPDGDENAVAPGLTGALLERYENADGVIERSLKEIDAIERKLKHESADAEIVAEREENTGTPQERHAEVFDKFIRQGARELNTDERDVLQRAQSVGTDSAGGYLVPEGFWNRISEARKMYTSMEGVVNVINTEDGRNLPWQTADTTAQVGEIVAEGAGIGEEDVAFGQRTIGAYKYSSKHLKVSWELLQDSAIDIEGYLARKLGERLGRIHNQHFTTGTGTGQPQGIVTGLTADVTAASATAVTHDELLDVVYGLDPAYLPNARFMFSHASAGEIRKVTDGDGNKVWAPSLVAGEPSTLLDYAMVTNQDMPTMSTGNTAILFGDFREAYVMRMVKAIEMKRLDELFALNGQVGFLAWDRVDGIQDDVANALSVLAMG